MTAAESLDAPILYTVGSGAQHGVNVGPPQPSAKGATTLTYGTIPTTMQQASDLYVATIETERIEISDTGGTLRGFEGTFHTAVDFPLTLPAAVPSVQAVAVTATPYSRVHFTIVGRAAAAKYAFSTTTRITDQVSHNWSFITDEAVADGAALDVTMPDLTGVAGFKSTWAPDPTQTTFAVTIDEQPVTVSDGTLTPFATTDGALPQ